ncbi:MAG: ROK family protein [Verrucomicrobiae bacterium]|nr:ROK family protein [Verrucomicrobiae bacterium]
MEVLGIDVGGSGIKGAIVDLEKGALKTERIRYETPQPPTPKSVSETIAQICRDHGWKGPMGVGFPAVVKNGITLTASNVDNAWIGAKAEKIISKATGNPVTMLNDADAAALAEFHYGNWKLDRGLVIVITVGTGLGTALIYNGTLIPNTELGHLQLKKVGEAEKYAADSARQRHHMSWKAWARRFNKYLEEMDFLFRPDEFIIGGGASKVGELFAKYLTVKTPVRMASLQNEAGIIGAALAAHLATTGQ